MTTEAALREALVSLRNLTAADLHDGKNGSCPICLAVRVADKAIALKSTEQEVALRTSGHGPYCARFRTFQMISDFVEKFQAGSPRRQLDLMHEYSDLIPKEILGAGIYEYTPRRGK